jgi:hypothetical protein
MLRLILRALVMTGLGLAPFAWVILSFKDEKTHPVVPIIITITAVTLGLLIDVFDLYVPHVSAARFKDEYVGTHLELWRKQVGEGVRINVLYVRRRWYLLFTRCFAWSVHNGFDPTHGRHHDLNMLLHVSQGVCGAAFRQSEIKFADLRNEPSVPAKGLFRQGPYKLWPRQTRKIRRVNLKAVLSIPMWKKIGRDVNNLTYKPVGVINLDATTDAAATLLSDNRQALGIYFADEGKLLALLPSS